MKAEEFLDIINKESPKDYGLCPPPVTAERGLDILIDHFLGKNWYTELSMSKEQTYTEAIYRILETNPRREQ